MMNRILLKLYVILLTLELGEVVSLRLLELDVPTHKVVGESAKLVCRFDMEGAALYSVKWYRNEQEFYRYVPNDRPKLQIFPQKGIKVERSRSSRQHVYLADLQTDATGTYRCEVSAEAPSFRTKHEEKVMVVVQPPKENEILGIKDRYYVGDTVNISCYSRGSSPPASLHWKVNGVQVTDLSPSVNMRAPQGYYSHQNGMSEVHHSPYLEDDKLINSYQVFPQQERLVARISDWFEKDHSSQLDTAASNMEFIVKDSHRHIGLRVECISSIGTAYWHTTEAEFAVSARERELPAFFSAASKISDWWVMTITAAIFLWNHLH